MDINDLKMFLKLSENLHFASTASEFFISPSSLTRVIQNLEAELGLALFKRDNRSVYLTEEGHRFRKTATEMLNNYGQFFRKIDGVQLKGALRLYCSVTASYALLPQLLTRFHNESPLIDIDLETGSVENAVDKIRREESDIAIAIIEPHLPSNMDWIEIDSIPVVFVGQKKKSQQGHSLLDAPFILPPRGVVRERALSWLNSNAKTPIALTQVNSYEAALSLVSAGVGVSVVPDRVLQFSALKDSISPLKDIPELCRIKAGLICLKKNRHQAIVNKFWACAGSKS